MNVQLGNFTADGINTHISTFAVASPFVYRFTEASDLLTAAGKSPASLSDTDYNAAFAAMMMMMGADALRMHRASLNFVPDETGRDGAEGNITKRIRRYEQAAIAAWFKIGITPDWAQYEGITATFIPSNDYGSRS